MNGYRVGDSVDVLMADGRWSLLEKKDWGLWRYIDQIVFDISRRQYETHSVSPQASDLIWKLAFMNLGLRVLQSRGHQLAGDVKANGTSPREQHTST